MIDLRMKPEVHKQYDYNLDLNERDDGDVLGDASMNDYLKGYQIEPYAFQQWAKKKNINLKKVAGQEMINMHFYPEFLADYILTLWNGTDGELQDFYEAFTLRYDNKLKKDVAKEIAKLGYKVYPVLVDDRAFYASKKRFEKVMKKASKKDIHTKMNLAKKLFQNSEAVDPQSPLYFAKIIGKKLSEDPEIVERELVDAAFISANLLGDQSKRGLCSSDQIGQVIVPQVLIKTVFGRKIQQTVHLFIDLPDQLFLVIISLVEPAADLCHAVKDTLFPDPSVYDQFGCQTVHALKLLY